MRQSRPTQNFWDLIWKDRSGRLVLWQMPNVWLIAWAGLTVLSLLFGQLFSGRPADVFSWAAGGSLIVWAGLEIFQGVNYFRRLLGLVVMIAAVATLVKNI